MNIPYAGGCACGAIRYECSAAPQFMVNCHCRGCQYASGASYTAGFMLARSAFKLLKGEPRWFERTADSGSKVRRGFCSDCGTPLFAASESIPDLIVVKPSSLDDPSWFKPQADIFTESAQPWDCMDQALPKFHGMPT